MIMTFNIENLSFNDDWFDSFALRLEDIRSSWSIDLHSLAYAAGMSYQEIVDFLDAKGIEHYRGKTSYEAVKALKEWYLKKMRRYVRNGLAHNLETGSVDEILFLQFCDGYRKPCHNDVRSWDDIDEFRLLQDFEAKCLSAFPALSLDFLGARSLLDRVQRSFLFHLRLKKTPKHNECRARTILSIILCNRYHIFTAEADSNVDATDNRALLPDNFKLNLPRSASRHVFASWQKHLRYDQARYYYRY